MFNRLFSILLFMSMSCISHANNYIEGKHYQTLDLPRSSNPTVTEYFSFYCPHCHSFEPMIAQLKTALTDKAIFRKSHVSFMGGNMRMLMSKAYATMVVLDIENTMIPAMFSQIHTLKKPPQSEAVLRQLFLDNGVDAKKFDATFNSFAVDSMVRKFDNDFKTSGLQAVPSIVVNNRYWVKAEGIRDTQEYIALVLFLLKQ